MASNTKESDLAEHSEKPKTHVAGQVPQLIPGKYADGLPLREVQYLAFKLILKPNRFISRKKLFDFGKVLREPAKKEGVRFSTEEYIDEPIKIREVLFVDTPDFRLYNNAFILRRRVTYIEGFPVDEPEVVFKFRHPDMQRTAEMDVRPHINGDHRVKFKAQVLPRKEQLGGIRMLYSHNVQFPRSHAGVQGDVFSWDVLSTIFPALDSIKTAPDDRISLVNNTIIEEVLQDIGVIDLGDGLMARSNVGIWRTRGEHRPLIGEFAFQIRFSDRQDLTLDAMVRAERFFLALQFAAQDYIALNATKTSTVYRLLGNAPNGHE